MRMANLCVFKEIPVEFLTAPVAEGHVFPFQGHGTSGADRIGVAMCMDDYFGDRQRGSVRKGFRQQMNGMPAFLLRG